MHSFRGKAGSKIANAAQCWGGSGGTLTHHQLHMGVHVSWRDMMPDPENISNIPRRHASISIWRLLLKMMFRCWRWVTYTKVHPLPAILTPWGTCFQLKPQYVRKLLHMLNCKLNSTNGGTFSNSAEKKVLIFFSFSESLSNRSRNTKF